MNKQKVPKLRFPGFTGEWQEERLGDVVTSIGSGKTKPNGIGSCPVYGSMGVIGQSEKHTHDGEFLLIARVGANAGSLKYVNDRFCVTDNTLILDVSKTHTLISFMYAALQNSNLSKLVFGSGQPLVTAGQLKSLSLYLPTLPEQRRIADFLSDIDTKIEKHTRKKELTEQYKKGVMQKIFSQKIRFKDEKGKNYPDWEVKRLGEVLHEHKEKSSGNEEVFSVSVHKGLINQIEHLGRCFSAATTDHYNLAKPGDVVYTKSPTGDFPFGIIKQSKIDVNVLVSPLYGVFTPETIWLGRILDEYFCSSINVQNYLNSIIQKGAKNTINITNEKFLSKALKLPVAHQEQKKIAEFLVNLDTRIEHIKKELAMLKEFKKGLLQGMFV